MLPPTTASNARDEIEAALQINGLRYRETGAYGVLESGTKATVNLHGSVILTLEPGDYSAVLYWKRLKGSTRPWYSSPSAIDGFAMGRILAAVGERDMHALSVYSLDRLRKTATAEWSDVGDSVLQFTLPRATRVTLSYNLPLAQRDNPQFSSWSDDLWSRIQTRLVIDGVAFRHLSSYVDGRVRGIKNARASMVLLLAGGTHTARLQWQTVDGSKWMAVSFVTDHASSHASVFLSVNAWNNEPKVVAPLEVVGNEDELLEITTIAISDVKDAIALDYDVTVRMAVTHGVLTLKPTQGITFASGTGVQNEFVLFSGALSRVNAILSRITYRSFFNWYGNDTLRIVVTDQTSTGFSPARSHEASVAVRIQSVNDAPQLLVPTTQFLLEDDEISIFGVSVHDVDVRAPVNDAVFDVQLSAISGVLSLRSLTNLQFLEGEGVRDQVVRFQGHLQDVNAALFELTYKPDRDFNTQQHAEQIDIRVIDRNERDGTTSEVRRTIAVNVESVDDPIAIRAAAMLKLTLSGYSVTTALTADAIVYARLQTMSLVGKIELTGALDTVKHPVARGPISTAPTRSLTLSGAAEDVDVMLKSLSYSRAHSIFGHDIVFVSLSHRSDFQDAEESAVQLAFKQTNSAVSPCVLTSVSPSRGSTRGGTTITVSGSAFATWPRGSLQCQFGPNAPVAATVVSDRELVCVSPANTPDVYSPLRTFVMVTDGKSFFSNPVAFVLEAPWDALSLYPASGPAIGGTRVRVLGERFPNVANMTCVFGDVSVAARFVSSSAIECRVPRVSTSKALGRVALRLTTNGQEFSRALTFTYTGTTTLNALQL